MTFYKIDCTWDTVSPITLEDLYEPSGRRRVSFTDLFPSEVAALSVLGMRIALEIEERRRENEVDMAHLETIREKLRQIAGCEVILDPEEEAPECPSSSPA